VSQDSEDLDLDALLAKHTIYNVQPRYLYHGTQYPLIHVLPQHNTFFSNRPNKAFALRRPIHRIEGTPGIYRYRVIKPIPRVVLLDTERFECVKDDPSVCKEANANQDLGC